MNKEYKESINNERQMIFEMIERSIELAEELGKHPLTKGCNCIVCVNKRKRIIKKNIANWEFRL